MKKQKSLLCLLLAAVLMLSACSGGKEKGGDGNTSSDRKGKYVETDITPDGLTEIGLATQKSDGTLIVFDTDFKTRYESTDNGASWSKSDGPGTLNTDLPDLAHIGLLEDDSLIGEAYDEKGITTNIVKIAKDGTTEDLALDGLNDLLAEGAMTYQLEVLPDGKLFLTLMTGIQMDDDDGNYADSDKMYQSVFDLETGKKLYDIKNEYLASITADTDYLYVIDYSDILTVYNLADGSEHKTMELEAQESAASAETVSFNSPILGLDDDGNIYNINGTTVAKMNLETGTSELIMDGTSHTLGASGANVYNAFPGDDDSFIVYLRAGGSDALKRYSFDENAGDSYTSTLNIWSLTDNETVRTAVRTFQNSHPETEVNLEIGLTGEGIQDEGDAIRSLNTRILADDGPDVLILDGCPIESYASNGILLDLTDKVDTSSMYEHLTSAGTTDNGTYYIPARFQIPVLLRSNSYTDSISDLTELGNAINKGKDTTASDIDNPFEQLPEEERPVMSFDYLGEVIEQLWSSSSGSIVKDGTIDTGKLETFLETVKQISDKYNLPVDMDEESGGAIVATGGGDEGGTSIITGSALALMMERAQAASLTLSDLTSLIMFDNDKITYNSFPGLEENAWIPNTIAGINAKTDEVDLAADFLQTLLSDEVQTTFTAGIPVTPAGVQTQLEKLGASANESEEYTFTLPDIEPLIKDLKTPVFTDLTLMDTISDHVTSYCTGTITLKEAVENIEQDTRNYLAERES